MPLLVFKIEHIPLAVLITNNTIYNALSKSVVGAVSYTSNIFNHEHQQRRKDIFNENHFISSF
jgi:hypothetical protein